MALNEEYLPIGSDIIGAAFDVMRHAGPGLREKYYEAALQYELEQKGHKIKRQAMVPVIYRGVVVDESYLADLVVDEKVIIEVKAKSVLLESECRQLVTYLKLSDYRLGYLINFGSQNFQTGKTDEPMPYKKGIYRFVNKMK